MKSRLAILLLCVSLGVAAEARATNLPEACGDDKVKFDVTTQKGGPPAHPDDGKAEVIIIEADHLDRTCVSCNSRMRFGLDGAWVGASQGNSYFAFAVAPGEHHLCANWQSALRGRDKKVGLLSLTAEAGKVYYFLAKIEDLHGIDFSLAPMNADEGKLLADSSELSVAKSKE